MDKIKFEELNCSKEILKAINDMGFEETTPIQTLTIPLIMEGKDVVGQAQTGTGKTAAFGIPSLEMISSKKKETQGLVLCPTRELAVQVSEEIATLGKYKRGLRILPVFGGQSIDRQINGLKKGAHIVIGTPGRVMDHLRRNTLKLDNLKILVLDEADEMLNMGFREDIETILESVKEERQTLLFSATMPKAILDIIKNYQKNPEIVKVTHKELTTPNINQTYLEVNEKDKVEILTRLIDMYNPKLSIVFCNTKKKVDDVTDSLQSRGYMTDKIHGDMKQTLRINVMNKFKRGDVEILVATDVAARGLDIDDVETVFNYDMPTHEEYYVHRVGRTGRAGRTGNSFSFVTIKDIYLLKNIMRYTQKKIKRHPIPSIEDIESLRTDTYLNQLKEKISEGNLQKYIGIVDKLTEEDFTVYEIAAGLLKMNLEMPDMKEVDLEPVMVGKKENIKRKSKGSGNFNNRDMDRLFINIGKNKKIGPKDIVGAIAGETGINSKFIGAIDVFDEYCFVDISSSMADDVISIMNNNTIRGNKISIERAKEKRKSSRKRKITTNESSIVSKKTERKRTRKKEY